MLEPSSIVEIDVRNTGASSAEPPKGETQYMTLVPVQPKGALQSTAVSVSKAAFFDGDATIAKPAIAVSRPHVENASTRPSSGAISSRSCTSSLERAA